MGNGDTLMVTRGRTVIIDGLVLFPPEVAFWKTYSFIHDGLDIINLPKEYYPSSLVLHVDGLEWNPAWYEEILDEAHRWKRLRLIYPILAGSNCWIRYYEAPVLA